ncbi:GNAT family N-acetyltransferase [Rugosimonospora africana]|uniref:Acetyltransferase n=1 Tax=Rugosimonospora africana TaxID=556532 RepID=A0A8J3VSU1_9ACTN|nr:GNAT family N-acetyltransferase [Rugosimonospora africana]GIH16976.1 acetyltransferase [Rugosimonospora africana]
MPESNGAGTVRVRPVEPSDRDALYDICLRTADTGADARGQYLSDTLVGDIFAVPYAEREPQHCFVVDDGTGAAVGYIVGVADTADFVRWYRQEWIPRVAHRRPVPPDPPVTRDDVMLSRHYRPERMLVPALLSDYPAHLHIDLLPDWQGKGWGRALMHRFLDSLRTAGVPRVHLSTSRSNVNACKFYDRLGFTEIDVPDAGSILYLGRGTTVE